MSEQNLEIEWARSQIEAMADNELAGPELERMEKVLARTPELRADLEAARGLLRTLRAVPPPAPPGGLLLRLLRNGRGPQPTGGPGVGRFAPLGAPLLGVCSVAAIVLAFASFTARVPDPTAAAALRDFSIAMGYLQRSAVVAQNQVGQQVGYGLFVAMELSSESLADREARDDNGG